MGSIDWFPTACTLLLVLRGTHPDFVSPAPAGIVAKCDLNDQVVQPGVGATDVDVIGAGGEYIAVGGPAKARNLAHLGQKLSILQHAADRTGVPAQAYFERGTPQSAIEVTQKILGDDNVFLFDR
jgi:hypothetical protein